MLNESGTIVTDATEIAEIFNAFYGSIASYPVNSYDGLDGLTDLNDVLNKHCSHDSIIYIRSRMGAQVSRFNFTKISVNDVLSKIKALKSGKSPGHDGIQDKFLKLAGENLACSLCVLFNTCFDSCVFPTSMKMADICPVYKKPDNLCKDNYRSVNLLTVFSKLFERIVAEQMTAFFENILSPLVSAYRKGYSCQHVVLQLTEYWRKALDENKYVGTLAMDLSKAFDCMPHGLLFAKLHAYGLSLKACMFIADYLKNRLQRVKAMGAFSYWTEINRGVPQGSVLRPLLFNIFINDLFFLPLHGSLVNYADDNHLCNDNDSVCVLQRHLETDSAKAVEWFNKNQTTTNADKFQSILLSRRNVDDFDIDICVHTISRDKSLKMLGVTLDDRLNFNEHIRNICQTASRQVNALNRISKFLDEQCRMKVYKFFICANFNYCPLVWMQCGKTNLNKLEKLQERALATVYRDRSLTYDVMLKMSGQLSIRMNLVRLLAIEIFKCLNGMNPAYLNELLITHESKYELRNRSRLLQPKFNTYRYGYNSFRYLGSKLWNSLPSHLKNIDDIFDFRREIYKWCLSDQYYWSAIFIALYAIS